MAKKKKQNQRSILEAQKAQSTVRSIFIRDQIVAKDVKVTASEAAKNSFTLPIAAIKKDLVKNGLFAGFAVIILIILSYTQLGYAQLSKLLNI